MSKLNRERVEEYLDAIEKGDAIAVIWTIDDVMCDLEVEEDEAREILFYADRKHDAEYGICWETFRDIKDMMDWDKKERTV